MVPLLQVEIAEEEGEGGLVALAGPLMLLARVVGTATPRHGHAAP